MKKLMKITAMLLVLVMLFVSNASAKSIILSGMTDADSYGVVVLITEKDSDIHNLKNEDIVWIDQQDVDSEGRFSITLPAYSEADYDFYSNALNYDRFEGNIKMYVASTAGGTGTGFDAENPTTLDAAYKNSSILDEIVIVENITYTEAPLHSGSLKITGLTGNEELTLPQTVSLKGNLTIDKLTLKTGSTIYANGYSLEIGENVNSDRMYVFGGKKSAACESTSLKLYGGQYAEIYGGGDGGAVTGNTNVILGGNANPGYSITSEGAAELKCYAFGGGRNAAVNGSTNITLEGNAITNYLVGAGNGTNATASETNVYINGGQVMNVYGGTKGTPLTNCNTHITMTAGVAESLFGGCEMTSAGNMTGNTYITVKGGEVLRRIYGGSYNNWEFSWKSDICVNGTTNVFLYPNDYLITGRGLSGTNALNQGVFATSRRGSASDTEIGSIFFMDGSYASLKSKIGNTTPFKSFHTYTVDSAVGGSVTPDGEGSVTVVTENKKSALTGGKRYMNGQKIALTKNAVTSIVYDGVNSADISDAENGTKAEVDVTSSVAGELYAAIFDENENLVSCGLTGVNTGTDSYTVNINCKLEANKKYYVKLFLWEGNAKMVPLSGGYVIEVQK